jgi:Flp pilus assembly protein TadD
MEAARVLAGAPVIGAQLERANAEFLAAQRFNAARPEAHLALGNFAAARGEAAAAMAAYGQALEIDAGFAHAAVNLADVHRALGDESNAEATLRAALARDPSLAAAHHALGLALVRQSRLPEALNELATAATLAPEEPRFAYVHAVALFSAGRTTEALAALDAALARYPDDIEMLFAAASYRAEIGDVAGALVYARRLQALEPLNPQFQELVRTLEQRAR